MARDRSGEASGLKFEAEAVAEFALAEAGDEERPAVVFAGEPLAGEGQGEKGGAERATQVGAALAPVETGIGETAALGAATVEVDAERGKGSGSLRSEGICGVAGGGGAAERLDPTGANELVVEGDGDGASHVVVAGARGAEVLRGAGNKLAARAASENAEALEGAGNAGTGEGVVAVTALNKNPDQVFRFEPAEVSAGGGGGDAGNDGKFGSGARVAVHEGVEHAGTGGLADGGGDGGDGGVDVAVCIHSFTVNEVWMRDKSDAGRVSGTTSAPRRVFGITRRALLLAGAAACTSEALSRKPGYGGKSGADAQSKEEEER